MSVHNPPPGGVYPEPPKPTRPAPLSDTQEAVRAIARNNRTELEAAVMAAAAEKLGGSDESLNHLLKKEGRATLAGIAGAALADRVKNDKLAAIAGGTLARVITGERVSGKDVARTALALFLTRKGTF